MIRDGHGNGASGHLLLHDDVTATLAHLEAGGAYVVRPVDMRSEIFAEIGRGLAGISRSTATGRRRYRNTEPTR